MVWQATPKTVDIRLMYSSPIIDREVFQTVCISQYITMCALYTGVYWRSVEREGMEEEEGGGGGGGGRGGGGGGTRDSTGHKT